MKKSLIIVALVTLNSTMVFAREARDMNPAVERIATRMMEKKESAQKAHSELKKCLVQNPNAKC